jgi:hypothetical protein
MIPHTAISRESRLNDGRGRVTARPHSMYERGHPTRGTWSRRMVGRRVARLQLESATRRSAENNNNRQVLVCPRGQLQQMAVMVGERVSETVNL